MMIRNKSSLHLCCTRRLIRFHVCFDRVDYICNVTVEICQAGVCQQPHFISPDLEFEELVGVIDLQ